MTQPQRSFHAATLLTTGVSCDQAGVFVGETQLLERCAGPDGRDRWQPRALSELNLDLAECYGLPVEFEQKIAGLRTVARALDSGDLALAQIATLHLRLPDPPDLRKSAQTTRDFVELARRLWSGGLLKGDWDPAKHPRWPAHSEGGIGGEFAPAGSGGGAEVDQSDASLIPAQFPIAAPMPFPEEIRCRR